MAGVYVGPPAGTTNANVWESKYGPLPQIVKRKFSILPWRKPPLIFDVQRNPLEEPLDGYMLGKHKWTIRLKKYPYREVAR